MTRIKLPLIGVTLHFGSKDGGPDSKVFMYGVECKRVASGLLLRFEDGSREAFHSHAFNAVSWVLSGMLLETLGGFATPFTHNLTYLAGPTPVLTPRERLHKVASFGRSWVLSFRGPWAKQWQDVLPDGTVVTLENGRTVVESRRVQ